MNAFNHAAIRLAALRDLASGLLRPLRLPRRDPSPSAWADEELRPAGSFRPPAPVPTCLHPLLAAAALLVLVLPPPMAQAEDVTLADRRGLFLRPDGKSAAADIAIDPAGHLHAAFVHYDPDAENPPAVYAACKAGLIGFSKTLAREHARHGITVNVVCPGATNTALFADYKRGAGNPEKLDEAFRRAVPMGRIGEPEDLPGAILFFCSDDAAFITGQVLSVSGGLTMAG